MRAEENARWEIARARREKIGVLQQQELDRIKETEKVVERWERADKLRKYAAALSRSPAPSKDRKSVIAEVDWIVNAADWLDRLVEKRWPLMDGAECEDFDEN